MSAFAFGSAQSDPVSQDKKRKDKDKRSKAKGSEEKDKKKKGANGVDEGDRKAGPDSYGTTKL